jgi:hypothetical protein
VLVGGQVLVERLVHVPEDRNFGHTGVLYPQCEFSIAI